MERDFRLRGEAGFSLLELLTVLVVVGLLAAVAVPSFLVHRDRALDSQAMANARAAQSATLSVEQDGGPGDGAPVTVASLIEADGSLEGADLTVDSTRAGPLTLSVRSETGNTFEITQYQDGGVDLTCASADRAGCPADGTWD
jgi:type IV pilus assembly protein PilA